MLHVGLTMRSGAHTVKCGAHTLPRGHRIERSEKWTPGFPSPFSWRVGMKGWLATGTPRHCFQEQLCNGDSAEAVKQGVVLAKEDKGGGGRAREHMHLQGRNSGEKGASQNENT